jgi:hypothetical protein
LLFISIFTGFCSIFTGSLTKSERPNRCWVTDASDLRPEYLSISCELRALTKKVREEFGDGDSDNAGISNSFSASSSTLFERGRFYEEYCAKRNERLKRKKNDTGDGRKSVYNLGVTVESAKKSTSTKKLETLRKSVSAAYTVERSEAPTPRYMLRSMRKENKKPPLAVTSGRSVLGTETKLGARRLRRD